MIRTTLLASLFAIAPLAAVADQSDWQDGVYTGQPADFFAGQSPAIIAFVKAHADLARDAQIYLSPCPDDGTQQICSLDQARLILDYIAAFYNDRAAQENLAAFLAGDSMPPKLIGEGNMQVGVSPDPVWGCAWRIATLTSGVSGVDINDLDSYKIDCESLSPEDQDQANGLAVGVLTPKIHAFLAHGTIPYELVDDYPLPPTNGGN